METPKVKIPFYKKRTFGEKMNASFDFIKENWRPLLKYSTYIILPLSLLGALSLDSFFGGYIQLLSGSLDLSRTEDIQAFSSLLGGYGASTFLISLATLAMTALIFAFVAVYNERENGLEGITFGDIRAKLLNNMGYILLLYLTYWGLFIVVAIVIGILVAFLPITLVIIIPGLIAVMVPLMLWPPIYIYEHIGLMASLRKALKLGFATWGGVFGISFVMGIIAGILQGVVSMPWSVGAFIKHTLLIDAGGSVSIFYSFMLYIMGVLAIFGMAISTAFVQLGLSYQYAHANERVNNTSVENEIDNFEQLS